jgi:hypothetical protein
MGRGQGIRFESRSARADRSTPCPLSHAPATTAIQSVRYGMFGESNGLQVRATSALPHPGHAAQQDRSSPRRRPGFRGPRRPGGRRNLADGEWRLTKHGGWRAPLPRRRSGFAARLGSQRRLGTGVLQGLVGAPSGRDGDRREVLRAQGRSGGATGKDHVPPRARRDPRAGRVRCRGARAQRGG